MKKKFFSIVLAFAFILTGAVCLTACDNGKQTVDYLYVTDGTTNNFMGSTSYDIGIKYGETLDLTKYKLFLYYTNGDTKEISRTDEKLSVKYYYYIAPTLPDDDKQEITALPDDMIRGNYTIEYVYDGNASLKATVNIAITQAESGNFTVQPIATTWQSQGTRSKVIVRNPEGFEVKMEWVDDGNGVSSPKPIEKTDDTDGHYRLYLFEKSVYDGFTEAQKDDCEFLYNYWSNDFNNENEHKVYVYFDEDENFVRASAGEYMLLAIVEETYNYFCIVTPAVQINVTAPNA